jgi:hypothetical protein
MFVGGPTWKTIGLGKQGSKTHRKIDRHPGGCIGSVGNKLIQCYLEAGLGLMCEAQSDHFSSCFPSDKVKNWKSPYIKKD